MKFPKFLENLLWPKKPLSPELKDYLTSWYEWATNGAPPHPRYNKTGGLCISAPHFTIKGELQDLLKEEFDSIAFPFGREDYSMRSSTQTQHLCPKRLAWVKSKIKDDKNV